MRTSIFIGLTGFAIIVGAGAISQAVKNTHQNTRWYAIDGDTIQHGRERIRLLRIDAPEMPGHCRPHRVCVAGDPWAAQAALQHILNSGSVRCEGSNIDVYGRTLAECFVTAADGRTVSVNDAMLANGHASPYHRSPRP